MVFWSSSTIENWPSKKYEININETILMKRIKNLSVSFLKSSNKNKNANNEG